MEIIPIHYKISKPVKYYAEIKAEAEAMTRFIIAGKFKGYYNVVYAIAHCQVSETPYAFFVVSPLVTQEKMFESQVIINPEILAAPLHKKIATANTPSNMTIPNAIEYQEPCMSFPFRKPKRLNRYDKIQVRYQIKGIFGFKTIKRELSGIASQIFQHEYDHTLGKNIYFESEKPVKWWELIGQKKPVAGMSLDQFDASGLTPAKEHARHDIAS